MKKRNLNRRNGLLKVPIPLTLFILMIIGLMGCNSNDKSAESSSNQDDDSKQTNQLNKDFAKLEDQFAAHIGVYAIDTGNDQTIEYHPENRFAYSSTFKVLAVANVLKQNEIKDLEKVITYHEDDLVAHSPVTEKHVDTGMTLKDISKAAIRESDNTAGNLLLQSVGGIDAFKKYLRSIGDDVTEPERYEVGLNQFSPGDKRDTSTPKMMATDLKKVTLDEQLSDKKSEVLIDLMKDNEAGDHLIRKGAPTGWKVADKSGAGTYGTRNDIAVVYPPNREPIVMAIMSRQDKEDAEFNDEVVAEAANITLEALK